MAELRMVLGVSYDSYVRDGVTREFMNVASTTTEPDEEPGWSGFNVEVFSVPQESIKDVQVAAANPVPGIYEVKLTRRRRQATGGGQAYSVSVTGMKFVRPVEIKTEDVKLPAAVGANGSRP